MLRRSGREDTGVRRSHRFAALVAAGALAASGVIFGATAPSAAAADSTATLTLTGITTNTFPTGGNTAWVQPGSALRITQSPINIGANQGLLGTVSGLVGGVLGGLLKPQIVGLRATVDLSSVGLGTRTLASGQSVSTPALAKGVYPIAWSFTAVTAAGQSVDLKGNQLNPLGLKLNAQNRYVGYIVSDTRSPCGGAQCIALQTPQLSVAPSVPVAGQLPTVTVPGQTVSVPVPLPTIPGVNTPLPSGSSSSKPSSSASSKPSSTTSTTTNNPYEYEAPDCEGPCKVVPRGGGSGGSVGNAYDVTLGDLGALDPAVAAAASTNGSGGSGTDAALARSGATNGTGQITVDPAFDAAGGGNGSGGPGTPTTLALIAGAALVASTALWLVRRRSAA